MRRMKKLQEIFDSPEKWTVTKSAQGIRYTFFVPTENETLQYGVNFSNMVLETMEDVEYEIGDIFQGVNFELPLSISDMYFFLRDTPLSSSTGITGTGHQFSVFSTVFDILKHYLKEDPDVDMFSFSGKEPSRVKLYRTFAQNIEKKLKYFKFVHEMRLPDGHTLFLFQRK